MLHYVPERGQLPQGFQGLTESVVAVFKIKCPSPSRSKVIELNKDGMPVDEPSQPVPPVSPVYANRTILHSDARGRSVGSRHRQQF